MELEIRVSDPSGNITKDVVFRSQDTHTVHDLVEVLLDVVEWPRETLAGLPIRYRARRLGSDAMLDDQVPVSAIGLERGDTLVLGAG